jgi:hypothetical protein
VNITCITPHGRRLEHDPASLLTPSRRETARAATNQWIKRLRLVRYGSQSMRERFTYRQDSLWWFTELYLHKMRRLDAAVETVLALDAAHAAAAGTLVVETRDPAVREATLAFGRARGVSVEVCGTAARTRTRWPSLLIDITARLSRLRPGGAKPAGRPPAVAAFVHTAFWSAPDPQQETYIGPVLDALVRESGSDSLVFVGLGPRRNFRARRWWDAASPISPIRSPVTAIERLAPVSALAGSHALWRSRYRLAADITTGDEIRAAARIDGCDLWPILKRELEAAALIQWPWSARAMDEAAAALDALRPKVMLTYAEAGAWGRALVLEARRRGVRSVGIQHGFIYRHWLNYLHEPDEMRPAGDEAGFPAPDRTLLYDHYAAEQLTSRGQFPAPSLAITGNARLEALAAEVDHRRPARDQIRRRLGVHNGQQLAVLAAKFTEIGAILPSLVDAASRVDGLHLVIKSHPAEVAAVYAPLVANRARASVAPEGAGLAELLAAADLVITMNSTVAVDGLVLGLPALVVGLPNNLSPFVEAGVMLGADGAEKIKAGLESVLYDREIRQGLAERAGRFVARYEMAPTPGAARRAAAEIVALAQGT